MGGRGGEGSESGNEMGMGEEDGRDGGKMERERGRYGKGIEGKM